MGRRNLPRKERSNIVLKRDKEETRKGELTGENVKEATQAGTSNSRDF